MIVKTYRSIEDLYLQGKGFMSESIPLTDDFRLNIEITESDTGMMKYGNHDTTSFTCDGDFGNYYALILVSPEKSPLLLNAQKIKETTLLLAPPNWHFSVMFPKNYTDYVFLWEKDYFESFCKHFNSALIPVDPHKTLKWKKSEAVEMFANEVKQLFLPALDSKNRIKAGLEKFLKFSAENSPAEEFNSKVNNAAMGGFYIMKRKCREGINIAEVCEELKISRRTLEISYKKLFGVTPGQHLRLMRLINVRKDLLKTDNKESVSTILKNNSITHFSHFGQYYKNFFRENMKDTLKLKTVKSVCQCTECRPTLPE